MCKNNPWWHCSGTCPGHKTVMKRGNGNWRRSWSDANSRLLHNARGVGDEAWRQYWDRRSEYYAGMTRGDERLRNAIVRYLARERILRPGDSVLDVGCGTGQYMLPMAPIAGSVTGLDVSEGMLSRMAGEAAGQGLDNVHPVRSSWEEFEAGEKYDLVFSAFCPGVQGPDALFKMERFCARSCCLVTSGGVGQPAFIRELMELLTGEACPAIETGEFFSFNVLHGAGRRPNVRSFSHPPARDGGRSHDVENAILYFDMLLGPDPGRKGLIEDYFRSHPGEEDDEEIVAYAVHWRPDMG